MRNRARAGSMRPSLSSPSRSGTAQARRAPQARCAALSPGDDQARGRRAFAAAEQAQAVVRGGVCSQPGWSAAKSGASRRGKNFPDCAALHPGYARILHADRRRCAGRGFSMVSAWLSKRPSSARSSSFFTGRPFARSTRMVAISSGDRRTPRSIAGARPGSGRCRGPSASAHIPDRRCRRRRGGRQDAVVDQ